MPELPEVETVRRTLLPHLVGKRITKVTVREARLRERVDKKRLVELGGRRVVGIRRRAKYLLVDLEGDLVLLVHLGMSGSLGITEPSMPPKKHDHVLFTLEGDRELRFNDPRRFGLVASFDAAAEVADPRLAHLGVEPLSDDFSAELLFTRTRRSKKPVKNFLMDGTRVVGVGNIYACEALFLARVRPTLAAGKLSKERCTALVKAVKRVLEGAIKDGGTTLRDFQNADGEAGYFATRLRVYGREGEACPRCGRKIVRTVMSGRSTFYCRGCQR